MIKQITKQQYLQVVGLLTLAKSNMARLQDIESSIRDVLQVTKSDEGKSGVGDPQHIGDAIYSVYSPDELLEKLGVDHFPQEGSAVSDFMREMGRKGGKVKGRKGTAVLSPDERKERARKAVEARWAKVRKQAAKG